MVTEGLGVIIHGMSRKDKDSNAYSYLLSPEISLVSRIGLSFAKIPCLGFGGIWRQAESDTKLL